MALSGELSKMQKTFPAGEVIFSEEDLTRDLYVLLRGKVEVLQKGVHLAFLELSGSFFGEMALLTGMPRSATLRAVDEALMLKVPPDKLPLLLKNMPDLAMRMAKSLASTVNNLNKELLKAWESIQLTDMIKEELDANPNSSLQEAVPKLFERVRQKQSENMLEVAQSYLQSNIFIQPFTEAIQSALSPFFTKAVMASVDESSDQSLRECICGIDFHGAANGTFIFMADKEALGAIGKRIFSDGLTSSIAEDTLMELARSIIEKVKESVPGLHMELSPPEIVTNFNVTEDNFFGLKMKTGVGFFSWIHLNR